MEMVLNLDCIQEESEHNGQLGKPGKDLSGNLPWFGSGVFAMVLLEGGGIFKKQSLLG